MIKVSSDADRVVVAKIGEHGQAHVFEHWAALSADQQKRLLAQLRGLDMPCIAGLVNTYRQGVQQKLQDKLRQPPDYVGLPASAAERSRLEEVRAVGENVLREGKIALLMAAGGLESSTGAETGSPNPKGTWPVGPVSGKPLYRLHAEKIVALRRKYGASLPLYIVTTPQTHEQTLDAFRDNEFYGLNRQDVKFLVQGEFPVADRRGRFVLAKPDRIAMRPNGHGDALIQVLADETFSNLELRGIEQVYYFQVDNPLVQIADPGFIGYHLAGDHEISCKMALRIDPAERIGVFCNCDGVLRVVEHDELSRGDHELRQPDGTLTFSAGNVAIHVFSIDFLRRVRERGLTLPYHAVHTITSIVDRDGNTIIPKSPNTVAFRTSIFDALAWSHNALIVETARSEEFAPIRQASGPDSPETASHALSRLHGRWLKESGAQFPSNGVTENSNGTDIPVEISPLFALDREDLHKKIELPFEVTPNLYLE